MHTLRPGEGKLLQGVTNGIDATGYQARDFRNPDQERANAVLDDLIRLVNPAAVSASSVLSCRRIRERQVSLCGKVSWS